MFEMLAPFGGLIVGRLVWFWALVRRKPYLLLRAAYDCGQRGEPDTLYDTILTISNRSGHRAQVRKIERVRYDGWWAYLVRRRATHAFFGRLPETPFVIDPWQAHEVIDCLGAFFPQPGSKAIYCVEVTAAHQDAAYRVRVPQLTLLTSDHG